MQIKIKGVYWSGCGQTIPDHATNPVKRVIRDQTTRFGRTPQDRHNFDRIGLGCGNGTRNWQIHSTRACDDRSTCEQFRPAISHFKLPPSGGGGGKAVGFMLKPGNGNTAFGHGKDSPYKISWAAMAAIASSNLILCRMQGPVVLQIKMMKRHDMVDEPDMTHEPAPAMLFHATLTDAETSRLIAEGRISLGGNYPAKIYGLLSCRSGKRLKRSNRVFFSDEAAALSAGFRPCGQCLKAAYARWNQGRDTDPT